MPWLRVELTARAVTPGSSFANELEVWLFDKRFSGNRKAATSDVLVIHEKDQAYLAELLSG